MIKTTIIQICDGCGATRNLENSDSGNLGGWREVRHTKHLCPDCIKKALHEEGC